MTTVFRSVLALCCALSAGSAVAQSGAKAPFEVVGMASYTGVAMNALAPAGKGFEAYIDYLNRSGGVDGHPIQVEVIDDQSSTNVGGALIQGAISGNALALVDFGLSTTLTQAKAKVANSPMTVLTGVADDSLLYPEPVRTIFMVNASAKQQAEALIQVASELIGGVKGKKIALALHQTAYNDSIVAALRQMAEPEGYKVVDVERFNLGIPSFSSQGARIARVQPDAVLVAAVPGDAPIVVGAISDAGVSSAPIVGYAALSSSDVFRKLNLSNFFSYRPYRAVDEVPGLAAKVGDAFKESMSSSLWTLGWATGEILAGALAACGDGCTSEKLTDTLESGKPLRSADDVLYGPVVFSKTSRAGLTAIQPYKLDSGKIVAAGQPLSIAK